MIGDVDMPEGGPFPFGLLITGAAVLIIAGGGFLLWRRRTAARAAEREYQDNLVREE